jgi:hypothetical protein
MNTTTITSARDTSRPTRPDTRAGRWTAAAGGAYVVSWLVGLALAPPAPDPDALAPEVQAFYVDKAAAVVTSSVFVHGTAAVALAAFAFGIARSTGVHSGLRRAVVGTGLTAAVLSMAQVVLAAVAAVGGDGLAAGTSRALFQAVNLVDVLKIAVLAAFVAAGTAAVARAGAAPRWLLGLAAVLVVLLPVTSAAFLVDSDALMTGLGLSLVLLLAWAGSIAVKLARRSPR